MYVNTDFSKSTPDKNCKIFSKHIRQMFNSPDSYSNDALLCKALVFENGNFILQTKFLTWPKRPIFVRFE